jgi:hypothetical protein
MQLQEDQVRTALAMAAARSSSDPDYRKRFLDDPRQVLSDEGFDCPANVEVRVLQDDATVKYLALDGVYEGNGGLEAIIEQALPIEPAQEVRLVQSTDSTRYVVLKDMPRELTPSSVGSVGAATRDETPTEATEENVVVWVTTETTEQMTEQTLVQTLEVVGGPGSDADRSR